MTDADAQATALSIDAAAVVGCITSSLAFTKQSFRQFVLHLFSLCPPRAFRPAPVPCAFVASPLASSALVQSFLPVWPSTRFQVQRAPWQGGLESAAAPVCREAGGRVTVIVRVQDVDLAVPNPLDNRKIEVAADGLPLPWCPTRRGHDIGLYIVTGSPHPRCANVDGAALDTARLRKEITYPELHGRTRLVVLGAEVVSRWSYESAQFVRQLAKAKARGEPPILHSRANKHTGGRPSWHAALPSLSHCRCWPWRGWCHAYNVRGDRRRPSLVRTVPLGWTLHVTT